MEERYSISREDLVKVIIALGRAESWLIMLSNQNPDIEEAFLMQVRDTVDLEVRLRDIIHCSYSEAY